jgi:hypothetical protein
MKKEEKSIGYTTALLSFPSIILWRINVSSTSSTISNPKVSITGEFGLLDSQITQHSEQQ